MGDKVFVICKLPNGIILDHTMNDGTLAKVTLRGTAQARALESDGNIIGMSSNVFSGHGVTEVDKDFWDAWSKDNEEYGPYKSGAIYALPSFNAAKSAAKERVEIKTGLEPLDPAKPDANIEFLDVKTELNAA